MVGNPAATQPAWSAVKKKKKIKQLAKSRRQEIISIRWFTAGNVIVSLLPFLLSSNIPQFHYTAKANTNSGVPFSFQKCRGKSGLRIHHPGLNKLSFSLCTLFICDLRLATCKALSISLGLKKCTLSTGDLA